MQTFEVVTVHKITDVDPATNPDGIYELDVTLRVNGELTREPRYISSPTDPYGANPAIRLWMSQNPTAQVHPYVPPTTEEIRATMPPLSARQFRLGLVTGGKSPSQVDAAIAAMPESTDKEAAKIEWEYATTFNRTHPLVLSLGPALDLTPEQIDTMWIASIPL